MGGAMSVNDGLPHLEREARWVAQAVEAGRPCSAYVWARS